MMICVSRVHLFVSNVTVITESQGPIVTMDSCQRHGANMLNFIHVRHFLKHLPGLWGFELMSSWQPGFANPDPITTEVMKQLPRTVVRDILDTRKVDVHSCVIT